MSTEITPNTLLDAIRYFSDPDNCLNTAVMLRWPDGVTCPTCNSKDVRFISTRRLWECKSKHPKRQFSAKVGSIFEDSPIGLDKWFAAIWLLANDKNGISSYEVGRALGVTQKTAWFMLHRIRYAMQTGSFLKMSGRIEADETFIGGLARNMHKNKRERVITGTGGAGKTVVMGLLERHTDPKSKEKILDSLDYDPKKSKKASRVKATVVPDRTKKTLQAEIRNNVEAGSAVFTDELAGYRGLAPEFVHGFVNHAEQYVSGHVHTNGMENFWSLLKRAIKGTYVSVEPFHLFRYLDEEAFRFNERKLTDGERFQIVARGLTGKRLTYSELTGKDQPSIA
jgi:transposase-like protein